jgi:hypothetical protein
MPASRNEPSRTVTLLNEAALALPMDMLPLAEDAHVIVAGQSLVRMTLAELSLPGAEMIWTDFRQSASLRRLHGSIQELGGLDQLVLAADGAESEAIFSTMCAILTFLPALRRGGAGRILLAVEDGPAVGSLQAFLERLVPKLESDGIRVTLQIHQPVRHGLAA